MLHPGGVFGNGATSVSLTGLTVEEIYAGQKHELVMAIRRALDAAFQLDFDVQSIARLMHNLAGTSSYFGEAQIGECAMRLEHPLRAANNADAIKSLCSHMLAVLD
ncbi:Hpt domain-containing protein [Sphingomonas jaspsi]|uniref:Hpt domain-containing protein n=1 Tax=Sphingomonas jaspsi TaxID=392409 RepID=UPI0004B18C95|nr:Hpt domain-containing protein [Sphingomonas jaspsi]